MTIIGGKITACTDKELYGYWLNRGLYYFYSYPDYKARMVRLGVDVAND